jgi:hypothetical protein
MLLLPQTLTSLEKQQVLDQAAAARDDYHLDNVALQACLRPGPYGRRRHWILERELISNSHRRSGNT